MARPPRVPDELTQAPFRGSTAVRSGVLTPGELRSAAWIRMLRGVYRHVGLDEDAAVRAEALRLAMPPDAVVSGLTAAWLHGVWLPKPGAELPLHYAHARGSTARGRPGTSHRRLVGSSPVVGPPVHVEWSDLVDVHGTPALSPMRTCLELVRDRPLVEAVVVVDAFAYAGAIDLPWFAAYVDDHRRWPGVVQARECVELANSRSRSPGESRLRMTLVLGRCPEPLVNPPMELVDGGVVYPDLYLHDAPRPAGLEYDGAYHDTDDQRVRDNGRENRIVVGANVPILRYDKDAVGERRHQIIAEVAQATGLRGLHTPDPWYFRLGAPGRRW